MKKYYRGLLVLAILILGLTSWIISIGIGSRQDVKTEKRAQEIATSLNDWVNKESKVPASLDAAGIKNVPDTISYTKKGNDSYEFCVTYKAAKDFGGGGVITPLITKAMTGSALGAGIASATSTPTTTSAYTNTALYLYGTHKKGKNCETIKPFLYSTPTPAAAEDTTSLDLTMPAETTVDANASALYDEYCSPSSAYYQYTKSYCETGSTTNMMAN